MVKKGDLYSLCDHTYQLSTVAFFGVGVATGISEERDYATSIFYEFHFPLVNQNHFLSIDTIKLIKKAPTNIKVFLNRTGKKYE